MSANLVEAGDIFVVNRETLKNETVRYALLIQFDSPEEIRLAIKNKKVDFTVFEHYKTETD